MTQEKVSMLRYRGNKKVLNQVKELDAFQKVEEPFVESTSEGFTLSVFMVLLVMWLMYTEISYYLDSRFTFKFSPDTNMDEKLKIHLDITVAMPCSLIGVDILDSTSQSVFGFGILQEDDAWFELTPYQREHFEAVKHINSYVREEYHSVSHLLWKSGEAASHNRMPERSKQPSRPHDACRVHGSLTLNKVAGNFHITAGKSLHLPSGHIHLSMLFDEGSQNFSHRIDRLSFGDDAAGIIHPLESDEQITESSNMLYQYFIDVVPTEVEIGLSRVMTYQYSVKEHKRPVDHGKGSHGMPGVFFKYDTSALKVRVTQERDGLVQFIVRLFSIVGGIYIIMGAIADFVISVKKRLLGRGVQKKNVIPPTPNSIKVSASINPLLITTADSMPTVDLYRMS